MRDRSFYIKNADVLRLRNEEAHIGLRYYNYRAKP